MALSTESVLAEHGVINQSITALTFASPVSKRFQLLGKDYLVRKMPDQFLRHYAGINEDDVVHKVKLLQLLTSIADNKILCQSLVFKGGTCAAMLGYL